MIQHHSQTETAYAQPQRLRQSRGRQLAGSLVSGVMLALILAGCTTPPAAPPTSTAATSTTPAVESTAPPPPTTDAPVYKPATDQGPAENVPVPVLPEKAKEFSEEGLVAFAEYWFSTLGYVFETGDSGPMMAVTEPGCKTCAFINEPIGQLYDEGGWVAGGQMKVIQSTTNFERDVDGSYQVTLMVQQVKVAAYDADKSLQNEHEQEPAQANMVVADYVDEQWHARSSDPIGKG